MDRPAGRTGNDPGDDDSVAASDTGRTEAFGDGVFAITITLLVLNLEVPEHPLGELLHALLSQWPSYVAFSVSFLYVGIVWLNHHALFRLVRHSSLGLNWANLGVLFGTVLLPFPTAVLAGAFSRHGNVHDERVAVTFYAVIAAFMSVTWLVMFLYLAVHRSLLEPNVPATWMRTQIVRPMTGVVLYLLAGLDRMGGDAGSRTDQHHRDDLLSRLDQRRRTEESLGPMGRAHS